MVERLTVAVQPLKVGASLAIDGLEDVRDLAVARLDRRGNGVRLGEEVQRIDGEQREAAQELGVVLVQQVHDDIVRREPGGREDDALARGVGLRRVRVNGAAEGVLELDESWARRREAAREMRERVGGGTHGVSRGKIRSNGLCAPPNDLLELLL